jgi:hypothetical protein
VLVILDLAMRELQPRWRSGDELGRVLQLGARMEVRAATPQELEAC